MAALIQPSFAAGEISPTLYGRVDLAKYHIGAAKLRNFLVDFRGGAFNRPGTRFVGRCKYNDRATRVVRFQFNNNNTYALEFGDLYIRVIRNGGYITEAAKTITGITQAAVGVVTSAAHGFSNDDWVQLASIVGMTQLNNRVVLVKNAAVNTFEIYDLDGVPIDTRPFGAYSSGGTASRIYTIVSPYIAADVFDLNFSQAADVVTITHPSYAPRNLSRTGHASWTLSTITFGSSIAAPGGVGLATSGGAGTTGYAYVVTAVSGITGDESIASTIVFNNAYAAFSAATFFNTVSWSAVADAAYYNVYRAPWAAGAAYIVGSLFGYIGSTEGVSFVDNNIIGDYSQTPPKNYNPFSGANLYPVSSTYFQQRRMFGGSNTYPETFWGTQPGSFNNIDSSTPVRDADGITATLASLEVNAIESMVPMPGGLVIFTTGGVWQVSGEGTNSPITPKSIIAIPQGYNGANGLQPLVINVQILYVQAMGSVVRDLSYNFLSNGYTSVDLTILAGHLFLGYTLVDWTWAEEPYKLCWAIRDDGKALTLTYLKDQEVYAWTPQDTLGLFKSVCSVSEGNENVVYFVTKRYLNGQWVQMTEQLQPRQLETIEDAWFVDCGLDYPLVYPAAEASASAASGIITLSASAAVFSVGNVGDVLRLGNGKGTVTAYIDTTHLTVALTTPITKTLDDGTVLPAASGDWSLTTPITELSGLDHLEGATVVGLADGGYFTTTVVDGMITLSMEASRAVVGLPYISQLQTLYMDAGDPTIQGRRKKISNLTVRLAQSQGIKAGSTFDSLTEIKNLKPSMWGEPIDLADVGDMRAILNPMWTEYGQVCIEQDYPLPVSVLAVIPEVRVGDN